jgi:branched-chain amino acid transport system ATP-binding protein
MSPDQSAEKTPLLRVDKVVKRFGGFCALDGASFHLMPGEVLGLVGPNGSGKTTCINIISGIYPPDAGQVCWLGKRIERLPSHKRVRLGINRTFQVPQPFLALTVRDNVDIAATYGAANGKQADTDAILASLELDTYRSRAAADLNSSQQKMLDLARALATAPRLLLVDELAAGLPQAELQRVARKLREFANSGIALLVVEHVMGFIAEVTDRVIVLNAGHEIFDGALSEAVRDPQVVSVFLGGSDVC